jgi:ribosome-binding factor A
MLMRDLRDPRLRGITLTGVKMDDDLRHGRVYFSHLEGSPRAPSAIAGFKSASGFIRREIGKALALRYTPELNFEFDPGLERAARIDALLKQSAHKD